MQIVAAGVSGFLGGHLVRRLRDGGHEVTRLVRRPATAPDELSWEPGRADVRLPAGTDVVVNLAGAGVGARRWTAAYKDVIRRSRVDTTATLTRAVAATDPPPVLLNSSAVGWYGDTGDRVVTEDAPAGEGFLAEVCRVWEAATTAAEDAGARVVLLRTGMPLAGSGGLLKPLLPLFRLGLGGRLGSGRQYMPWLSLADWLDAVEFLLDRPGITGPVNLVGPAPATNAEFTKALGRALRRPAALLVPAPALRIAVGEFGAEAVAGQRALPAVLTQAGFTFTHPDLDTALPWALTH